MNVNKDTLTGSRGGLNPLEPSQRYQPFDIRDQNQRGKLGQVKCVIRRAKRFACFYLTRVETKAPASMRHCFSAGLVVVDGNRDAIGPEFLTTPVSFGIGRLCFQVAA